MKTYTGHDISYECLQDKDEAKKHIYVTLEDYNKLLAEVQLLWEVNLLPIFGNNRKKLEMKAKQLRKERENEKA